MNIHEASLHLKKNGYFIWDDFLSLFELDLIRKDYFELQSEGKFRRAGIGKDHDFQYSDSVRRDETYWLNPLALEPSQQMLWTKLELIKDELNRLFFLGLWNFEGHYSFYPIGGLYQPHLDRFSKDDARTISMVLYLNQDWNSTDGGELRIHPSDQTLTPIDISPIGGRLVCFLSADTLHEVLPTKQNRYSFSGWWKKRDPR